MPLITAALSLLENKKRQEASDKAAKISAARGQAPPQGQQPQGKMGGVMDILGKMNFQSGQPQRTNGLSQGTQNQLNDLGFTGEGASSDEDLLGSF